MASLHIVNTISLSYNRKERWEQILSLKCHFLSVLELYLGIPTKEMIVAKVVDIILKFICYFMQ